ATPRSLLFNRVISTLAFLDPDQNHSQSQGYNARVKRIYPHLIALILLASLATLLVTLTCADPPAASLQGSTQPLDAAVHRAEPLLPLHQTLTNPAQRTAHIYSILLFMAALGLAGYLVLMMNRQRRLARDFVDAHARLNERLQI